MGEDSRLADVVTLAQGMAAAHSSREAWWAAACGACRALGGSFAALSVWERELGRLRVLVNVGELAEGEEEFPEDESYPVHQFAEITEFLHERWAGGGEPDAWVETAEGAAEGRPGYCHQRVAALRRRGRGCCVVAPIVLHGRAWGELYVARPVGAPVFARDDADFATVLAAVVAAGSRTPGWSPPRARRRDGPATATSGSPRCAGAGAAAAWSRRSCCTAGPGGSCTWPAPSGRPCSRGTTPTSRPCWRRWWPPG